MTFTCVEQGKKLGRERLWIKFNVLETWLASNVDLYLLSHEPTDEDQAVASAAGGSPLMYKYFTDEGDVNHLLLKIRDEAPSPRSWFKIDAYENEGDDSNSFDLNGTVQIDMPKLDLTGSRVIRKDAKFGCKMKSSVAP